MESGKKKKKETDLARQSVTSIKKGMRSLQKEIELHKSKIANPSKHIPEWDSYPERKKAGLIKHWNKEIVNLNKSIEYRRVELRERGECDD